MRWKDKPKSDLSPWRKWFAWLPVKIDDENVWLEWVERYLEKYPDYTVVDYRHIAIGERRNGSAGND